MSIGFWQIVLILLIVLIIFGSGKLPKVMEDLARGLKSFRDGMGMEDSSRLPKKKKASSKKSKKPSKKKSLTPPS